MPSRVILTTYENHPVLVSSLKMSLSDNEDVNPTFARASKKTTFMAKPSCVPTNFESQSLVSSSSDSQRRKSMGFRFDVMRSQSGLRRMSLGILFAEAIVERPAHWVNCRRRRFCNLLASQKRKKKATDWWLKAKK